MRIYNRICAIYKELEKCLIIKERKEHMDERISNLLVLIALYIIIYIVCRIYDNEGM